MMIIKLAFLFYDCNCVLQMRETQCRGRRSQNGWTSIWFGSVYVVMATVSVARFCVGLAKLHVW